MNWPFQNNKQKFSICNELYKIFTKNAVILKKTLMSNLASNHNNMYLEKLLLKKKKKDN